jgi:outer membrane protein assembly factor BamB
MLRTIKMYQAVTATRRHSSRVFLLLCLFLFLSQPFLPSHSHAQAATKWAAKLDSDLRFYQTTELGALIVGTERSLYALDGESGEVLWRRKNVQLDETDVAPLIGTDLLLLSLEKSGRTRLEAVDLLTGKALWQSDKLRGSVMQLAVDLPNELAAVVLVRDAKERAREGFKRKPTVHLLNLADGREHWRYELESDVEMTPVRWFAQEDREIVYALDNYRAPLFLDGRLYLFYEGVTALDVQTGKARWREGFRVNEEGLALTEADPIVDEQHLYASGRGRVRALSRETGKEVWEAKDLGLTPELWLTKGVLYARTGGQFTRLKDGEIIERGPYGVSAIDATSGKILWRYRGADKGLTNLSMPDANTILLADRDEIVNLDTATGKPRLRVKHRVERPAFVLINEQQQAVVGGREELAAFAYGSGGEALWLARHAPPGRGVVRTIAAIAARSAALYFRFGGVATTAFRGVQLARAANSLRWSGLVSRVVLPNLTDYAAGAARDRLVSQIKPFGALSRLDATRRGLMRARRVTQSPQVLIDVDVEERLLDRLDPAHQLDKLARFLWRKERLSVVRGQFMYFYTDLKPEGGRGLAGVNFNTGKTERTLRLNDPDYRLTSDEVTGLLYTAQGNQLLAYPLSW